MTNSNDTTQTSAATIKSVNTWNGRIMDIQQRTCNDDGLQAFNVIVEWLKPLFGSVTAPQLNKLVWFSPSNHEHLKAGDQVLATECKRNPRRYYTKKTKVLIEEVEIKTSCIQTMSNKDYKLGEAEYFNPHRLPESDLIFTDQDRKNLIEKENLTLQDNLNSIL